MKKLEVSFKDIQLAEKKIRPYIKKTSMSYSEAWSQELSCSIFFKWETEQEIKSFKIRGALNKVFSLTKKEQSRGLIAASAGNHAQGVAFASQLLGIKSRVVMMKKASKVKVLETQKRGAQVILEGNNYDESYEHAQSIQGDSIFIHPFADPYTVTGQGTLGFEIFEQLAQIDSLIIPVGGGGLLAGLSSCMKHLKASVTVYGMAWEGTPDFCRNFNQVKKTDSCFCQKNQPPLESKSGLTDGVAVKKSYPEMVEFCLKYVDGLFCVSEKEISSALLKMKEREGKILEGSGVIALAGLLKHHKKLQLGQNCCVIISGANIDQETYSRLTELNSKEFIK